MISKGKPTKDNRKYFYDVRVDGIRYRSKKFATRQEAQQAEAEFLTSEKKKAETLTFSQLIDRYKEIRFPRLRPMSVLNITKILWHIEQTLGKVQVENITSAQYERFLAYLNRYKRHGKPLTGRHKNEIVMYFKSLCRFAKDFYGIDCTIANRYPLFEDNRIREVNIITPHDFALFIREVKPEVYRQFFIFLYNTGMRLGEANALLYKDIDFEKKTVSITKTVNRSNAPTPPKTKNSIRVIKLSDKAFGCVEALKTAHSKPTDYVFGKENKLSESQISRAKDNAIKASGVEYFKIHDLRHSFISNSINAGAPATAVSKYVGHASVTVTLDVYTHASNTEMRNFVDFLNRL